MSQIQEIDVNTLEAQLKAADPNTVLIDVRQPEEWAEGVVEQAERVSLGELPAHLNAWDKSKSYYLICRSGARSYRACEMMAAEGFQHLTNIQGGMLAWKAQGYTWVTP